MTDQIELSKQMIETIEAIYPQISKMYFHRSKYSLEHFVVGQHMTPERQKAQIGVELLGCMQEFTRLVNEARRLKNKIKMINIQISRLDLSDEINLIMADDWQIDIEEAQRGMLGIQLETEAKLYEAQELYRLFGLLPDFTLEQMEDAEPGYWKKRLIRQMVTTQRDAHGNLEAMLQMKTEVGKFIPEIQILNFDVAMRTLGLDENGKPPQLQKRGDR